MNSGRQHKFGERNEFRSTGSWLVSFSVHMGVLMMLALWIIPPHVAATYAQLTVTASAKEEQHMERFFRERVVDLDIDMRQISEAVIVAEDFEAEVGLSPLKETSSTFDLEIRDLGERPGSKSELLTEVGGLRRGALHGRNSGQRAALLRERGGTSGSEEAVVKALRWLVDHQNEDGGWSLDHGRGPCQGRCENVGLNAPSRRAATALALLPLLGAGHTHTNGNYQSTVDSGLSFLLRSMQVRGNLGSFYEPQGTMYSHGLASIVLCEAYAMTQDATLLQPAQRALNFIAYAQDPMGGGWRYEPHAPGDLSMVGWQMMALKSGHMAYLKVPRMTILKASRFLDRVQSEGGAYYGYRDPGRIRRFSTTAIGLLCRMYTGWQRDHPALLRGVQYVGEHGPAENDYYANYYATQVMFQYTGGEGEIWERWNSAMREQLITSQAEEGHAKGSWFAKNNGANEAGGRLYCTAMGAMMLEVYYRHMPIYGKAATEDEF